MLRFQLLLAWEAERSLTSEQQWTCFLGETPSLLHLSLRGGDTQQERNAKRGMAASCPCGRSDGVAHYTGRKEISLPVPDGGRKDWGLGKPMQAMQIRHSSLAEPTTRGSGA